jgi:3-isopropylmalate/(R)-2-methylmalate dehydratase small subunit
MSAFPTIHSPVVALPVDNIDTDQIIPARFLRTTSKEGLGDNLFYDWRYGAEGRPNPDFVLNQDRARDARILVAGDHFGCGSSREHAPWALVQFGFRAVVSTSFGDIFRQNALKNALLPVVVSPELRAALLALEEGARVTIDLEQERIVLPGGRAATFHVDPFARHCLLEGIDELGYILQQEEAILAHERARGDSSLRR